MSILLWTKKVGLMNYNEYLKMQKEHSEKIGTEQYFSTGNYTRMSKYLRTLIPKNIQKMLEIGCNAGYESTHLEQLCFELISIDISEKGIEKTKKRGINAFVMDMHKLTFENDTFDCVYANNVIEHAIRPNIVLNEIHRVLKNGGFFVFAIPQDGIECGKTKEEIIKLSEGWNPDLHVFKVTKDKLKEMLINHAFKIDIFEKKDIQEEFGMIHIPSNNTMLFGRLMK